MVRNPVTYLVGLHVLRGWGDSVTKNWYTSRFVRVILAQGPC
jgi:hypothetical protein